MEKKCIKILEDKCATPTFYYFGYGSNMLAKRIRLQNPSAKRIGAGKLQDYRLDFHTLSKHWLGSPATIVPTEGKYVLGAIWKINEANLKSLDEQEGVGQGIYTPITVPVLEIRDSKIYECRTYHLVNQPVGDFNCLPRAVVPYQRQPSMTYLKTLVKGAIETGLDDEYVNNLRSVRHNGKLVHEMEKKLELKDVKLACNYPKLW